MNVRKLTQAAIALSTTAVIVMSGCSGVRQGAVTPAPPTEQSGPAAPAGPAGPSAGAGGAGPTEATGSPASAGSTVVGVTEITQGQAPAELANWAAAQQMNETPGYTVLTHGEDTYVGVAGGVKRSGGYRIALKRASIGTVDGQAQVQIDVAVIPPRPGAMTTDAMVNPMAFFSIAGTAPVIVHFVSL